ncbi:MAG: hypothetical protein M3Q97_09670 [Bacteroidota bacterium]|nr:hypothetical protein [Bacteroidota bacterium]
MKNISLLLWVILISSFSSCKKKQDPVIVYHSIDPVFAALFSDWAVGQCWVYENNNTDELDTMELIKKEDYSSRALTKSGSVSDTINVWEGYRLTYQTNLTKNFRIDVGVGQGGDYFGAIMDPMVSAAGIITFDRRGDMWINGCQTLDSFAINDTTYYNVVFSGGVTSYHSNVHVNSAGIVSFHASSNKPGSTGRSNWNLISTFKK